MGVIYCLYCAMLYPILSQSDGDSLKTEVRHKAGLRDANGIVVLLRVVGVISGTSW